MVASAYFCLMQYISNSRIILYLCSFRTNLERHHLIYHERDVLVALVHLVVLPHCVGKESVQYVLLFHLDGIDGIHQI